MAHIKYVQVTNRVVRIPLGSELVLSRGERAMITRVACQPGDGYRPPEANDRWGWRSDVEDLFGDVVIEVAHGVVWSANLLTLMDVEWRLLRMGDDLRIRSVARTLDYLMKKCAEELPTLDGAAGALPGAVEAASWAWNSVIAELSKATLVTPPCPVSEGAKIELFQCDRVLGSDPIQRDKQDSRIVCDVHMMVEQEIL